MNRLKEADFGGPLVQKFDVSNLNYDLNGNIESLTRNNDTGTPSAHLNYLLFDKDFKPVDGGFAGITASGVQ